MFGKEPSRCMKLKFERVNVDDDTGEGREEDIKDEILPCTVNASFFSLAGSRPSGGRCIVGLNQKDWVATANFNDMNSGEATVTKFRHIMAHACSYTSI